MQDQTTLTSVVHSPKKYGSNDQQQQKLTHALLTFIIAGDLMPLSIVESTRFHAFVHSADPRFQFPSRKLLRVKLLPEKSAKVREGVMQLLKEASNICVTVDLWSTVVL